MDSNNLNCMQGFKLVLNLAVNCNCVVLWFSTFVVPFPILVLKLLPTAYLNKYCQTFALLGHMQRFT